MAMTAMMISCQKDPELTVSKNDYSIGAQGGEISVDVSSNINLTASINADWLSIVSSTNSGGVWRFAAARNDTYEERSARIIFSGSGVSETVTVSQSQQDAIIPTSLDYVLFYESQDFSLPLSSNVDYSVSSSADWIKQKGTRGLSNKELLFSVEENSGKMIREATITISSGALRQSIRISQLPTTHSPETLEEWHKSTELNKSINKAKVDLFKQLGSEGNDEIDKIVEGLNQIEGVIEVIPNPEGNVVSIMQRDSIWLDIFLDKASFREPDYLDGISSQETETRSSFVLDGRHTIKKGGKALILSPFQWNLNYHTSFWKKTLDEVFSEVSLMQNPKEGVGTAGIDAFKGPFLETFDFIIIATHGGFNTYHEDVVSSLLSGTIVSDSKSESLKKEGYIVRTGTTTHSDNTFYEMVPSFLNNATFDKTAVILAACSSAVTRTMVDKFRDKKASFVVGFEQTMFDDAMDCYVSSMVQCLSNGISFYDAHKYSTESEIARRWADFEMADLEKTGSDPSLLDIVNNTKCFPEKPKEDLFFVDPIPVLDKPLKDNPHCSWTCGLSPFSVTWILLENYYRNNDNLILHSGETEYESNFSIEYEFYIDGELYSTTTETEIDVRTITSDKSKAYVIARIKEPELGTVDISYKSNEEPFTLTKIPEYIALTTGEATNIYSTRAQITSSYETNWDPNIVERGIVYSSSRKIPEIGYPDCSTAVSSSAGRTFSTILSSLKPGTKYYARSYVTVEDKNACTNHYGKVIDFETADYSSSSVGFGVDKLFFNLEDTPTGGSSHDVVTITNIGDVPLTRLECSWEEEGSSPFHVNLCMFQPLNPGEKIFATVVFEPKDEGVFRRTLLIRATGAETSGLDLPATKVYFTGIAFIPKRPVPDTGKYSDSTTDLGLSVNWATCNLGASTFLEAGNLYAWGETVPRNDIMEWKTYKWSKDEENTLTKYCLDKNSGYNGFVDWKTVLDPSDDPATAKFGNRYRVPSLEEWQELVDNCSWTWYSNYRGTGVQGYKVTSKVPGYTDKFIFLPAAEPKPEGDLKVPSDYGDYMINSLYRVDNPGTLFDIFTFHKLFISSTASHLIGTRGYSLVSVRPVCVKTASKKPMISFSSKELQLGKAKVGTVGGKQDLIITNIGNATLVLSTVKLVDGDKGFVIPPVDFTGTMIEPNESFKIQVRFKPTMTGDVIDNLLIKSNAENYSYNLVTLYGTGTL